ncbi:aminotransferase, class III [Talaromyces stipitatus ATCC 10500]|uniref:Aminotransferase, class III n=1 Tax=Talaromyces stipitatus (strain ATCC 10500 / CBS 375.48 / QM 6759 / NRRL 1006) TaxID=441959 RepID=B8M3G7_TALSN|nr:aminotransferase, class III [Talaromyces stipitatus ATCC 10500]EED22339.1 aminotransferase, class III [Talaromyces stipitatus ATCC 10500]
MTPSAVLHRHLHQAPTLALSGEGSYISLEDGRRILDATGGAAVSCLGHNNEHVKQAMIDQINQLSYCHTAYFSTKPFEELASLLIESTGGKMSRVYIVGSGSEAMEAAMKLARQFYLEKRNPEPQRTKFIARNQSYHGITIGSLSMGGHKFRRELFEPILLPNVSHVSPCNPYRNRKDSESDADYVARLVDELDAEFQRLGPETVCAFVAEPVVGAAMGCVPSVPGYFKAMKAVCEKYGALFILDEVMSGMGRCGTLHAWQQEDVVPDMQTIGKGLGGGYAPVAGLLIGDRVIKTLEESTGSFRHGHTYQGHPVSCAAALAVQKAIQKDNLVENVREMGIVLEEELRKRLSDHPHVGDIRGKGLFWGIEFVRDKTNKEPFDPKSQLAFRIQDKGLEAKHSISLYGGQGTADGVSGDHILLAPPYNSTREEIVRIAELVQGVVEDVFGELDD